MYNSITIKEYQQRFKDLVEQFEREYNVTIDEVRLTHSVGLSKHDKSNTLCEIRLKDCCYYND